VKFSANCISKFVALPFCGGGSVVVAFGSVNFSVNGVEIGFVIAFFVMGFVLTMIVGWPLLALLEWKFHRCRLRYIFGGVLCALLTWLFMEGAFFSGGWENVWSNASFWNKWAPRWLVFYSLLGLGAGALYTAIVAAINWKFPPPADSE